VQLVTDRGGEVRNDGQRLLVPMRLGQCGEARDVGEHEGGIDVTAVSRARGAALRDDPDRSGRSGLLTAGASGAHAHVDDVLIEDGRVAPFDPEQASYSAMGCF
jgi:hypothetical protein